MNDIKIPNYIKRTCSACGYKFASWNLVSYNDVDAEFELDCPRCRAVDRVLIERRLLPEYERKR